jgi:PhzF family phenazine biosynthesis protein
VTAYRFKQVDVFTERPFFGNPVAVVLDADGLEAEEMQRIARWTNLSETTFVLRPTSPDADYRLRIFTPGSELPFAGHPTVGSAHAVIEAGVVPTAAPRLTQECDAGLIPLSVSGDGAAREICARAPLPKILTDRCPSVEALSAALRCPISENVRPLTIDVGPIWAVAGLDDPTAVRDCAPDMAALTALSNALGITGVTIFSAQPGQAVPLRVRSFAPAQGVPEDPVCGSGNAAVGSYLAFSGLLAKIGSDYTASQGTEIGRDGVVRVHVEDEGRTVTIGGHAVTVVDGTLRV